MIGLFVGVCSVMCLSAPPSNSRPIPPELKLRTTLSKQTFTLDEQIAPEVEFTNLTNETLCFPPPDQTCEGTANGSLITRNEPTEGQKEVFFCHVDGPSVRSRENLLQEIEQRWTKLGPNTVFVIKGQAQTKVLAVGEWRVWSTYSPPVGAFDPPGFKNYMDSATNSFGCTIPRLRVKSEPVLFRVVAPDPN
jgi:hypothetical protein